jgi:hypothetical protein
MHRSPALLAAFSSFVFPINNVVSYFVDLNFCDVMIPRFLAPQGPKNIFPQNLSSYFYKTCLSCSGNVYRGGPLVGATKKILAAGTKFNQMLMAGPTGGCCRYLR